jgi:hypothetical protein
MKVCVRIPGTWLSRANLHRVNAALDVKTFRNMHNYVVHTVCLFAIPVMKCEVLFQLCKIPWVHERVSIAKISFQNLCNDIWSKLAKWMRVSQRHWPRRTYTRKKLWTCRNIGPAFNLPCGASIPVFSLHKTIDIGKVMKTGSQVWGIQYGVQVLRRISTRRKPSGHNRSPENNWIPAVNILRNNPPPHTQVS